MGQFLLNMDNLQTRFSLLRKIWSVNYRYLKKIGPITFFSFCISELHRCWAIKNDMSRLRYIFWVSDLLRARGGHKCRTMLKLLSDLDFQFQIFLTISDFHLQCQIFLRSKSDLKVRHVEDSEKEIWFNQSLSKVDCSFQSTLKCARLSASLIRHTNALFSQHKIDALLLSFIKLKFIYIIFLHFTSLNKRFVCSRWSVTM